MSIKVALLTVLGLNVIAFLCLWQNFARENRDPNQEYPFETQSTKDEDDEFLAQKQQALTLINSAAISEESPYTFDNPIIAYQLLSKLDVFVPFNKAKYSSPSGGFTLNNDYCDQHRAYFVEHPELVFNNMNIVSNYWRNHKLRTQVIPRIGNDLYPLLYPGTKHKKLYNMRLDANMFFTYNLFFPTKQIGKQFSCLSQSSNHIPGNLKMARKDYVGRAAIEYAKKYKTRPSCFNFNKYFPKTWVLQHKAQCDEFFKEFNSQKYQDLKKERNVVYFRKMPNVHEGKGVFPVNNKQEAYLKKLYKNGAECGKIKDNNMMQYNIHNLLLIQNRKFGLRMFMFVASTNPVIAYYHDGYARLSMNEYDPTSQKVETFVTNIGVNLPEAQKGMKLTPEQIQEHTSWSLEDMQDYLLEVGRINDKNWLQQYFRPEVKKVMIHLIRMAQMGFYKTSTIFELLGLDFMLDDDLNVWFIEANPMPLVNGFTKRSTVLINKMLEDTFEIVLGLQRSRMKRVITYINSLTKEINPSKMEIKDLAEKRKEFKKITKNYFEPEFMPSSSNTFEKIIDENLFKTERYVGLIKSECL